MTHVPDNTMEYCTFLCGLLTAHLVFTGWRGMFCNAGKFRTVSKNSICAQFTYDVTSKRNLNSLYQSGREV